MITRDGELATIMQQKEEDEAHILMEKEYPATTSTPTGRSLLLVQCVLTLHVFLQSSIPHNSGVASKATTLEMDIIFSFADRLLNLQVVFRVSSKNSTVDVGYLWYLGCIIYQLLFGSPLCNVDSQQIIRLLYVLIYHCFHLFAMCMLLLLAFLA